MEPQPLNYWQLAVYLWNNWSDIQNAWQFVLQAFWSLIGAIVTLASLITPFTKTVQDDKLFDKLKGWIHQFSVIPPKP